MSDHTPGEWGVDSLPAHDAVNIKELGWVAIEAMDEDVGGHVAYCDPINAPLIAAAPELLSAARCALADLEGIIPDLDFDGEREHPAWKTIEELRQAINKAEGGGKR